MIISKRELIDTIIVWRKQLWIFAMYLDSLLTTNIARISVDMWQMYSLRIIQNKSSWKIIRMEGISVIYLPKCNVTNAADIKKNRCNYTLRSFDYEKWSG